MFSLLSQSRHANGWIEFYGWFVVSLMGQTEQNFRVYNGIGLHRDKVAFL